MCGTQRMTTATVIALVAFNLAAEWRGLYRPWRAERLTREVRVAITTWLVVPPVLMAFGFVTKIGRQLLPRRHPVVDVRPDARR